MKKKVTKWFLPTLLAYILAMTTGCGAGNEDEESYVDLNNRLSDSPIVVGIFEGEWTVNKQVVDTALLVVSEYREIQVRLPESYLLGLCFPNGADAVIEPANLATLIEVHQQGYSETSQYMSAGYQTTQTIEAGVFFVNCSFMATIDGKPYSISLLSNEIATAMMQISTGQWTIGIPIDAFSVTNLALSTYKPELVKLPQTVTIYYNTKRRIE